MGKNLIQQRRGRGTARFRSPGFKYEGSPAHISSSYGSQQGRIAALVHCAGHSAPLARIVFENNHEALIIAPENVRVGDTIEFGGTQLSPGSTVALADIPEGTLIYNIESSPGDGGKFVRTSGVAARVISRLGDKVRVMLPSKKERVFNLNCRASIGTIAGGGRKEKPLVKAGNAHYKKKARNKFYPHVSGVAMNAVAHPFGGSSSSTKGRPTIARKNAPAGAKVGMIRPRRSGRRKR